MITERDREIVDLLDRAGGLEATSLRLMLGLGHAVVYRRLARLEEYGMVRAARPFRNVPGLYVPTRLGMRELLGLDEGLVAPSISASNYNHEAQVGRVMAQLEVRGVRWETERLLRRRERDARGNGDERLARRYCLRLGGVGPSGITRMHRPDALIWREGGGRPLAVEVELALKTRRRLDEILGSYTLNFDIAGVVYICGPDSHGAVKRAVERGRHGRQVTVTTLDSFGPGVVLPPRPGRDAAEGAPGPFWIDRHLAVDRLPDPPPQVAVAAPRFGEVPPAAARPRRKPIADSQSALFEELEDADSLGPW